MTNAPHRLATGIHHVVHAAWRGDPFMLALAQELTRLYAAAGEPQPELLRGELDPGAARSARRVPATIDVAEMILAN